MITLKLPDKSFEQFDEKSGFSDITIKGGTFRFEHSLRSISKWESRTLKPFLSKEEMTPEETLLYFEDMVMDGKFDLRLLRPEDIIKLTDYIKRSQTATHVTLRQKKKGSMQVVTSEVLYASMTNAQVPWEADRWPLSRLMALLEVLAVQNGPKEKMSKEEIIAQQRRLNEERRRKMGSKG